MLLKGKKMEKVIVGLFIVFMVMGYSIKAQGNLITIGTATYAAADYKIIYDDDNQLTWFDYATPVASWNTQKSWASGLNAIGVLTYNFNPGVDMKWTGNWRLPATLDGIWNPGTDGTTTAGYNITTSELGHLYYTELGNNALYDTDGVVNSIHGLINKGDFDWLNPLQYWSDTDNEMNETWAWKFDSRIGLQSLYTKTMLGNGLAVRSGTIVAATVPEPTTVVLLGIGIVVIAVYGVRRRRQC